MQSCMRQKQYENPVSLLLCQPSITNGGSSCHKSPDTVPEVGKVLVYYTDRLRHHMGHNCIVIHVVWLGNCTYLLQL